MTTKFLEEISIPVQGSRAAPASGSLSIYPKTTGWFSMRSDGTEFALQTSGSPLGYDWSYRNTAALKNYRSALAAASSGTEACNIYFVGDSLTEGFSATTYDNIFVERFRRAIQKQYNPASIPGGAGYRAPMTNTIGAPAPGGWTYTGNPALPGAAVDVNNWSFGNRYVGLSAGQTAEYTFYGTDLVVFYTQGSGTGVISVSIDGGAAVTQNTMNATTQSGKVMIAGSGLTRGTHTAVITAQSGTVVLDGILISDGDVVNGVRVYNGGRAGFDTVDYNVTNTRWTDIFRNSGTTPDLVVIGLGGNDITAGTTVAQFETNLGGMVDRTRNASAASASTSIVIMAYHQRGTVTAAAWQLYVDAMERVAAAKNVAFADFSKDYNIPATSGVSSLYVDSVHLNDAGHAALADRLLTFLDSSGEWSSRAVTTDGLQTITGTKTFTGSLTAPLFYETLGSQQPLKKFREALSLTANQACDILSIGASVDEGYYAVTDEQRYIANIRRTLQARYNPPGVIGGEGFIPARHVASSSANGFSAQPQRWTYGGGWALQGNWTYGIGRRYAMLDSATETATITVTGDRFWILYLKGTSVGSFTVTVDGGAPATVDAYGTLLETGLYDTGQLSAGSHTIVIQPTSGSTNPVTTTRVMGLEGIMVFNGDGGASAGAGKGVRWWDAGHSGYKANDFNNTSWMTGLVHVQPDLVTINFGGNEYLLQQTSAEFDTNLRGLITKIRATVTSNPSIALIKIYDLTDLTGFAPIEPWINYEAVLHKVAAEMNCALIDLGERMPAAGPAAGSPIFAENIHVNPSGHKAVADEISQFLINDRAVGISPLGINATGTPSSSTFLRGDGVWAAATGSAPANMVTTDTAQTITGNKIFQGSVTVRTNSNVGTGVGFGRNGVTTTFIGVQGDTSLSFSNSVASDSFFVAGPSATLRLGAYPADIATSGVAQSSSLDITLTSVRSNVELFEGVNRVYSAANPPPATTPSNMATTDTVQTITGAKTFTAVNIFEGGVLSRHATATAAVAGFRVTGDVANRVAIQANGTILFGDGTNALTLNLYRTPEGLLATNGIFAATQLFDNGSRVYSPSNPPPSRLYAATIGDGTTAAYTITHNFNTRDVIVQIYTTSGSYTQQWATIDRALNSVTITFRADAIPTTNQYRVVILGG